MNQKKINYIFGAVIVVLSLILGWFGMTLPVQPEIPSPLPTPDFSGYVTAEELALVQRNIEALSLPGAESFTVSGDSSYSTNCYQKQGGNEWVADSGCTWAVLDGGTLEVQAGATFDISGYFSSTVTSITAGTGLITGNLTVSGTSTLVGDVTAGDDLTVTDVLVVGGGSDFNGAMNVDANGDFDSLSTLAIDSDSYWDSTGDVQINDNANVTGTLTIAGVLKPGFADETITNNEVLTPTKTAYALDSAGNVTMTLAASAAEGQLLILMGDDANTITIADTNIRTTDGNAIALGQYDVVMFVYQDAEWLEMSLSANQ